MGVLPLFEHPSGFDRAALAGKLDELARQDVWIGTSSWKYEGWLGQIYTPERYLARGKFSRKQFEEKCLAEYSETFPIVCGDFAFYQFPTEAFWEKLFCSAPPNLRYAFKVPEDITRKAFPVQTRYGARAGLRNPGYLDPELFDKSFLKPLHPYSTQVPLLIFEFGTFSQKHYSGVDEFLQDLDPFLEAIPKTYRYSVEVRNREFLTPQYFGCLRDNGIAHVFNAWARMPELHRQIAMEDAYTADFTVTRGLLAFGRPYEKAVEAFSPYDRIQEENPAARKSMHELIERARRTRQSAYLFVNNRLEGNAPMTIEAIVRDD
jgi:uncharacterized protein YecE (DUF72 family)